MDAKAARDASKQDSGATFIPGVEACHIGPIPLVDVADVLLVDQHDWNLSRRLGKPSNDTIQQIDAFEATLPAHEENPLMKALRAGRRRARGKPSEE